MNVNAIASFHFTVYTKQIFDEFLALNKRQHFLICALSKGLDITFSDALDD